jgi:hypothetical protein
VGSATTTQAVTVQAGTGKLVLSSAGTAEDALTISTSAGGINITNGGAAAGEDIDIAGTLASVNVTSAESAADAIVLNASLGGVQILASGAADAEDILLTATGSSIFLTSTQAAADAIKLNVSDAAGGITVAFGTGNMAITGTGVSADFTVDGDVISIDGVGASNISVTGGAGEDLTISQLGNADASVHITSTGTGVDAVSMKSTTGGVDIDGKDDIIITCASTTTADDLALTQTGAVDAGIILTAAGTGADAIGMYPTGTGGGFKVDTTDGAISLVADGASNGDITLDTADTLTLTNVTKIVIDGMATQLIDITGTTAGGFEHTLSFTDATVDTVWTFPTSDVAATLSVMSSTLATNYPDIANSVTGGTGTLIFEGTKDAFETIITPADATVADAIITLPNDSGGVGYIAEAGSTTKDATDAALPLTDAVVYGTSDATSSWTLPDGKIGQILTVVIVTDGGAATITPTTPNAGWATVVLSDDVDTVTFMYIGDTLGWMILGTASDGTNIVQVTQ